MPSSDIYGDKLISDMLSNQDKEIELLSEQQLQESPGQGDVKKQTSANTGPRRGKSGRGGCGGSSSGRGR